MAEPEKDFLHEIANQMAILEATVYVLHGDLKKAELPLDRKALSEKVGTVLAKALKVSELLQSRRAAIDSSN